ncbi:MAG: nitroreductase family deazaflavin-dependent oxidoreductase [Dehalococcoidia bacterium]|nr:nitroreductase family deazaflavin-dependent oxidoreductase [Dehalococcoidia bacterium]
MTTNTTTSNERNRAVIEEFRANGGKAGGVWEGRPLVLLTTTGAKTGRQHTTPLMSRTEGDRLFVFASKGGAPESPAWYHNLVANPTVTVEVGAGRFEARAVVLDGPERDRVYAAQATNFPQFGEYQTRTTRQIPVIALERIG